MVWARGPGLDRLRLEVFSALSLRPRRFGVESELEYPFAHTSLHAHELAADFGRRVIQGLELSEIRELRALTPPFFKILRHLARNKRVRARHTRNTE